MDHLTFAERGASRYFRLYRGKYERDEFVSAAYTGLVVAARKFDPSRGCKFTTYAFQWIDQYLKRMTMIDRRQTGWSFNPTKAERAAGKTGMVKIVEVNQFPEAENKHGELMAYDHPDPSASPEEQLAERDERRWQQQQILETVKSTRTLRMLREYLEGASMEEIARRERVSRARVHQLLQPALKRAAAVLSAQN